MAKKTTKSLSKKDAENIVSNKEYIETLAELKKRIRESQLKAAVAVNRELLCVYWSIGRTISDKQEKSGWGSKVIERLVRDIQNAFPGLEGFSRTNIFRMRVFYKEYKIVPPVVGQIDEIDHLGVLTQIPWSCRKSSKKNFHLPIRLSSY